MAAFYAKSDILDEVRRIINEPTARVFSDTEINAWIDTAARRISVLTLCNESVEAEDSSTFADYDAEAVLGNKFIKLEYVTMASQSTDDTTIRGLQRIDPRAMGHVGDATIGVPRFYFFFEDTIFLWSPVDKASNTTINLKAFGYTMVDDYGAGASETLPDEVQHITIDYVLSCCYCKDGKHSLAADHMRRFMQNCMLARRDVNDEIIRADRKDMAQLPDYIVSPEGQIMR